MFVCEDCGWRGDEPEQGRMPVRFLPDGGWKTRKTWLCPECGAEVQDIYHKDG